MEWHYASRVSLALLGPGCIAGACIVALFQNMFKAYLPVFLPSALPLPCLSPPYYLPRSSAWLSGGTTLLGDRCVAVTPASLFKFFTA